MLLRGHLVHRYRRRSARAAGPQLSSGRCCRDECARRADPDLRRAGPGRRRRGRGLRRPVGRGRSGTGALTPGRPPHDRGGPALGPGSGDLHRGVAGQLRRHPSGGRVLPVLRRDPQPGARDASGSWAQRRRGGDPGCPAVARLRRRGPGPGCRRRSPPRVAGRAGPATAAQARHRRTRAARREHCRRDAAAGRLRQRPTPRRPVAGAPDPRQPLRALRPRVCGPQLPARGSHRGGGGPARAPGAGPGPVAAGLAGRGRGGDPRPVGDVAPGRALGGASR